MIADPEILHRSHFYQNCLGSCIDGMDQLKEKTNTENEKKNLQQQLQQIQKRESVELLYAYTVNFISSSHALLVSYLILML